MMAITFSLLFYCYKKSTIIVKNKNRERFVNSGILKNDEINGAEKNKIAYKKRLIERLKYKIAVYSSLVLCGRRTKADVKPLSIKILLNMVKTDNAPIRPKSFGVNKRAVKIPTNKAIT